MLHKRIPKDYNENLDYRIAVNNNMVKDAKFAKQVKEWCKEDIIYWVNTFCSGYETRDLDNLGPVPFITWQRQDEYLLELMNVLKNGGNLVVEKSRDVGISYLTVFAIQHLWLFGGSGYDFLVGSYAQDLVDTKGVMSSLLHKFRTNLKYQPKYFLPKGYNPNEHDVIGFIKNPETNSSVTGKTQSGLWGSGGRYTIAVMDEYSKWERGTDKLAWSGLGPAVRTKIAIGTPTTKACYMYKLLSGNEGKVSKFKFHWTDHPDRDEEWKARVIEEEGPVAFAREYDINWSAESVEDRACWNYDRRIHIGKYLYNNKLPIEVGIDFNWNPLCMVVSQTVKGGHRYTFKDYKLKNTSTEEAILKIIEDFKNTPTKVVRLYGDPTGHGRVSNSRFTNWAIVYNTFKRHGWRVSLEVPSTRFSHEARVQATNKRLRDFEKDGQSFETITPECEDLIESIEGTQVTGELKIVKNNLEHLYDAWSYTLVIKYPVVFNFTRSA